MSLNKKQQQTNKKTINQPVEMIENNANKLSDSFIVLSRLPNIMTLVLSCVSLNHYL